MLTAKTPITISKLQHQNDPRLKDGGYKVEYIIVTLFLEKAGVMINKNNNLIKDNNKCLKKT